METIKWVLCPICGNKTRTIMQEGTYEWLNIEKIDKKTLQIKVERNAGTIRKMRIAVTCGDFFDYIVVTQKGLD